MRRAVDVVADKHGVSRQAIWNKVSHRIYALCATYMKANHPKEHAKIRDYVYRQFGVEPRGSDSSLQMKRLTTALNGKKPKARRKP